ncbi:hypothetical protein PENTCL1PPCAC_21375, partial [Pristionchus entomophagus]
RNHTSKYRTTWRVLSSEMKVIETSEGDKSGGGGGRMTKKRAVAYALLGTIKAEFFALKQSARIKFSAEDMKFLMNLKRINHDNLATFIGVAFNEVGMFYIMNALVDRCTLAELIQDEAFNMDERFKSAFMRDILKGMAYLHKPPINYHGLLNPTNCLIDGNWVLKLSQFGFTSLVSTLVEKKLVEMMPTGPRGASAELAGLTTAAYLSTAPEKLMNLELLKEFPKGDAMADIYSLSTVLFCILAETATPYTSFLSGFSLHFSINT